MLRTLSVLFALAAVVSMIFAIAGMVTGREGALTGWVVRTVALLCFAVAVVLNVAAH
ncbi:MAG: hypothetical protein ACRDRD_22465 [Pseudonocardiaceae bacterium]